jgi:hypothetical protein
MAYTPSPNLAAQDFFTTTLTNNVAATDTVINLANVPAGTEGYLVIDPNNPTTREIIYYNSKSSSTVTTPDATANSGRGIGGTSVQTHLSGVLVEQRMVAEYWNALQNGNSWAVGSIGATAFASGWAPGIPTPSAIVANGNRSYTLTLNGSTDYTSTLSNGMRLQLTRTVAAPSKCTSLNGTTQYYSKTSPAGMTFTNNFVVSAWVKLTSYAACSIASRYNGTSGWDFQVLATGQLGLVGYNAGAANVSYVVSYQSIPLNKWVHVAAQLDMATFTATTTTSYTMIDGVDVPASVIRGGTNPTALIQAGNLEIGSRNGGLTPFPGKIAQVAIYNAKVTQANIVGTIGQTLVGTETSLISAYSFNNSINDLNVNANNLTANGSAVATNADSPFAGGVSAGLLEYGEIFSTSFSSSTILTVQVPEGYVLPTTGGISAVSYSTNAYPYGWPGPIQNLAYILSATTTATASGNPGIQIPALTASVYVPQGRKLRISVFLPELIGGTTSNGGGSALWDGVVNVGTQLEWGRLNFTSANPNPGFIRYDAVVWATAGSHTYNVSLFSLGGASISVGATTIYPAWLSIDFA